MGWKGAEEKPVFFLGGFCCLVLVFFPHMYFLLDIWFSSVLVSGEGITNAPQG